MPTVFTDLIVGLIVPAEVKYDQAQARSCRIAEGGEVSAKGPVLNDYCRCRPMSVRCSLVCRSAESTVQYALQNDAHREPLRVSVRLFDVHEEEPEVCQPLPPSSTVQIDVEAAASTAVRKRHEEVLSTYTRKGVVRPRARRRAITRMIGNTAVHPR